MANKLVKKGEGVGNKFVAPEEGYLIGYAAIIDFWKLRVPWPRKLALINIKFNKYQTEQWLVFTPKYQVEHSIFEHLTFALKYEGIDLLVIKKAFEAIGKDEILNGIKKEPLGSYSRRIWFLYEWLMQEKMLLPDLKKGNYVDLINPKIQYPGPSENSSRHRIRNNLPGVPDFCPLIWRTPALEQFLARRLEKEAEYYLEQVPKDILWRTAAFLLLKDSKASFAIEGETPIHTRAQRWGKAIGEAGKNPLSIKEMIRLQKMLIGDNRFTQLGIRQQEGFVGEHDRQSGMPIPIHISARHKDLEPLMKGLLAAHEKLIQSDVNAVFAAALISFGFVFIHPFVDGNGRMHRYLIHHILAKKSFSPKGMIFPVSAAILQNIEEYRSVLEQFSNPRLDLIEWEPSGNKNVEIKNETADLYRFFDATPQTAFLFNCVQKTLEEIIPEEVNYLKKYERFKFFLDNHFSMPDRTVDLLLRFLQQGEGKLSKRALKKEFFVLTSTEVQMIEEAYLDIFE